MKNGQVPVELILAMNALRMAQQRAGTSFQIKRIDAVATDPEAEARTQYNVTLAGSGHPLLAEVTVVRVTDGWSIQVRHQGRLHPFHTVTLVQEG